MRTVVARLFASSALAQRMDVLKLGPPVGERAERIKFAELAN
jgi:hypothetical protein